jgi:hypothetical protein
MFKTHHLAACPQLTLGSAPHSFQKMPTEAKQKRIGMKRMCLSPDACHLATLLQKKREFGFLEPCCWVIIHLQTICKRESMGFICKPHQTSLVVSTCFSNPEKSQLRQGG